METYAKLKNSGMAAQKVRLVADQIRGLRVDRALNILEFSTKDAARIIKKVLNSAIANAEHNHAADIDELKISEVLVDESFRARRFHARARGRAAGILKRYCHIKISVSDGRGEK